MSNFPDKKFSSTLMKKQDLNEEKLLNIRIDK